MIVKYCVRVKLSSGVLSVLEAKGRMVWTKRTAKKHCAEMVKRGFESFIEEA